MGGAYRQLLALVKIFSHSQQLREREHTVAARINKIDTHKLIKRASVCCF